MELSFAITFPNHSQPTQPHNLEFKNQTKNISVVQDIQWPNLKNLSGGLNLSRGLNMVGST